MNSSLSFRVEGDMEYTSIQQSPTPKAAILKFLRVVVEVTRFDSDWELILGGSTSHPVRKQRVIRRFGKALINKDFRLSKYHSYLAHMSQQPSSLIISLRLSNLRHVHLYVGFRPRYPCGKWHPWKTNSNQRFWTILVLISFKYVISLN